MPAVRKSMEPWIKDEVVYYEHQVEGIRKLARQKNFILADEMGLGKLAPYSEPILTPRGWVRMGDLSINDQVIGSNGKPADVIGIFEQGIVDIVRVTFSDGSYTRCGWEHLWEVNTPLRKNRGVPAMIKTTREIYEAGLTHANGNRQWFIPMVQPVEFDSNEQEIDPYTLGVLLGDGCLSGAYATITSDRDIVENLLLPEGVEAVLRLDKNEYCSTYGLNGMASHLRKYDLMGKRAEDKFIPSDYLWGIPEARIALLQGLLDTDGSTVRKNGKKSTSIEYGTVSPQLALDVKFLVQSLGGTVSISEKNPTYTYLDEKLDGQLFYRMVLHLPEWFIPFRLQRKADKWIPRTKYVPSRSIVSIEPDGIERARCIKVAAEDGLYVTREFIVTHNTLQAITVFAIDIVRGRCNTAIVVCPASLKINWEDEFTKFTGGIHIQVLDGTPTARKAQIVEFMLIQSPKVLIVNYEQVTTHLEEFNKIGFDVAIFDEAHYIKNPKSKRSKACLALRSKRSFMLTGTPLLNNVAELWTLFHRVNPTEPDFKGYWRFVNRFAALGGYTGHEVIGVKNEQILNTHLRNYMLRRRKNDVLDLPEVQIITKNVKMLPEQQKLYNEVITEMKLTQSDGSALDVENGMTKLLRLKQIMGTTLPFNGKDISAKFDLAEIEDEELVLSGEHIVVFTQFRDVNSAYAARLQAKGLPVFTMTGDDKPIDRPGIVKKWESAPPGVLICMFQVGGVGLNMTKARHGVFLDKLFVPGLNKQAIDRMHRIGADKTQAIQIRDYQIKNSAESRINEILKMKEATIDKTVDSDKTSNLEWHKRLIAAALQGD